jgi:hypothetical protein
MSAGHVIPIQNRVLDLDDGKSEKEIHELARLARRMRKQEARLRDTIGKLEGRGVWVGVRVGAQDPLPIASIKIDLK